MSTNTTRAALSQSDKDTLEALRLQLRPYAIALRMWENTLEDEDRHRWDGNLENAWRDAGGTLGIWMRLRGVSVERAIIDVASALEYIGPAVQTRLLKRIGEPEDDADRKTDTAISASAVVLIARPRQAFWRGEPIEIDWDRNAAVWSFFWELSRSGKLGRPVTHFELGERVSATALSTRKARLVNDARFPGELGILIEAADGGGYLLKLPAQEIRLFEEHDGVLTEVFG